MEEKSEMQQLIELQRETNEILRALLDQTRENTKGLMHIHATLAEPKGYMQVKFQPDKAKRIVTPSDIQ